MKEIPKKTFYYVRHGQTDANAQGLMCGGDWDISLNEKGLSQASGLSEKILSLGPSVDEIRCSPMVRAQQTAELINKSLLAPVTTVEGLKEWCVGDWEKKPWETVPDPIQTNENPPNGESQEEFGSRVLSSISLELENSSKTLLFVSHGAFAYVLFAQLGLEQNMINNCEIYRITFLAPNWKIEKV
jgi:broad specificity phosphatase PhoE